ncbi:unnamed protein product [Caenorhabditis auriculariae]|uniref:Copper type II ascorbate-dependent monooxygenase C-terminal domain-containing protein n=1 Tax=Caenorhabditis auriculariae TaxID=2777116 RepID=A0A8S1HJM5_9PELO|nr:unnamed protein product [Caenorhabditis auriculariae]
MIGYQPTKSNMSCNYESRTDIHPFAFRTHTHAMGRAVSAFFKHNGVWTKIGHRNPQWPQGKFGLPGIGPTQFELPHDIVANDRGNLLIADRENGRVQELTTEGKFVGEYRSRLFFRVTVCKILFRETL